MQDSKKILSDNNVSITNPRILVLEALLDNKNPITIDELLTKLENQVAKSTLYRVLSDLKKINILQEFTNLENQSVVELLLDTDSHHHHLFCSDCGEIIDVEMANEFEEKLSNEIKRIEKKFNFIIEDHRLELFGKCTDLCENCS
jgi:Fur family ferric uptake transcriptional regulator